MWTCCSHFCRNIQGEYGKNSISHFGVQIQQTRGYMCKKEDAIKYMYMIMVNIYIFFFSFLYPFTL